MYGIDQRTNASTRLPPRLPPLTPETLFILFMFWSARRGLGQAVCCFAASPRRIPRTARRRRPCAASDLISPRCFCFTPSNCQSAVILVYREKKKQKKKGVGGCDTCSGVSPGEARSRLKEGVTPSPDSFSLSAVGWNRLLFPECHQMTSSLMSVVKLNLHTHTHISGEAI